MRVNANEKRTMPLQRSLLALALLLTAPTLAAEDDVVGTFTLILADALKRTEIAAILRAAGAKP